MFELAKRFIDKECCVNALNHTPIIGVIKEVNSSALLIETYSATEVVNLNFVICISEYHKNKKDNRK